MSFTEFNSSKRSLKLSERLMIWLRALASSLLSRVLLSNLSANSQGSLLKSFQRVAIGTRPSTYWVTRGFDNGLNFTLIGLLSPRFSLRESSLVELTFALI
jgi:hypothetical protein